MKKGFSLIGILIGGFIIALGAYILIYRVQYYENTAEKSSLNSITFGADYYTEQYRATKEIAEYLCDTRNTMAELPYLLPAGIFTILFGFATMCYFGCKYGEAKKEEEMEYYKLKEQESNKLPEL